MTRLALFPWLCAFVFACDKKQEPTAAPAPSAAASTSPTADAGALTFTLAADGRTRIDMPGRDEHIRAETHGAKGALQVDPRALANSRGEIAIDLSTLSTSTFDDPKRDGEQTTHARTWLEAVVDGKVQEAHRYARLQMRSVEIAGMGDLAQVPLTHDDAGRSVRHVDAVLHGDVEIHGHTVARTIALALDFEYADANADPARPSALHVRTREPFTIVLKEHGITPRDPIGKVLAWTSELTHRVATEARVDVDLRAERP